MSIMQLTQTIHILPSTSGRVSKRLSQPMLPGMEPEEAAPTRVTNRQIAEVLSNIADLIAFQNGNPYRIQAYRNAARGILDLPEPAADILARGEELPVPGLGERLRARIAELVEIGTMTIQNGICMQTLPQGVRILMTVEHIGPNMAIRLYEELGIDTLEKLWWAAHQQRIRRLPGFGARSEARIKEAVEKMLKGRQKVLTQGAA
jgi:DNA polymerase/3'-5' exonuclease PolX